MNGSKVVSLDVYGGMRIGASSDAENFTVEIKAFFGEAVTTNDISTGALTVNQNAVFKASVNIAGNGAFSPTAAITGLDFARTSHSHTVSDISNFPNLYSLPYADKIHRHGVSEVDGLGTEISALKNQIGSLEKQIVDVLVQMKAMEIANEMLVTLIRIQSDIGSLTTAVHNLDSRIVVLEGAKANVDALTTAIIDIGAKAASNTASLGTLETKVSSNTSSIAALTTRVGALEAGGA